MSYLEIIGMMGLGFACGISKLGIPSALIFSPILAAVYGGKAAAGIIIIPVMVADLIMLYVYRKNINKKLLFQMLPLTCLGLIVAVLFGNHISDVLFNKVIGILILIIGLLSILKTLNLDFSKLSLVFGFLGGIASYIGNVSGPLMSIYLLNIKIEDNKTLDRDTFLGTRTWFYFIVNIIKFVCYLTIMKSVNLDTLNLTKYAIPFVFVGVFVGKFIVEKMNQNIFEKFIIIASIISGLKLLI